MLIVAVTLWLGVILAGSALAPRSEIVARSLFVVGLTTALGVGIAPLLAASIEEDPTTGQFGLDRAQAHIELLARRPHPIGSAANADVRDYLVDELIELGLEPETQTITAPDYYGSPNRTVEVTNVLARISGTASTGAVAIVAHFDTVPQTPGANDNSSGVAIALETARAVLADEPLRNDVVVVLTDGEEPAPRFGSTAFVRSHPWAQEIGFVVNLEAIGPSGPSLVSDIHGPQSSVMEAYQEAVPVPVAYSFLTETTNLIGGSNTDFAPFRDADIPGVEFVYARGSSMYHTAADTPDTVSPKTLHAHGTNTLALVRHMAAADLDSLVEDGGSTFFTVGRFHLVRYSNWWTLQLAAVNLIVLAWAAYNHREPIGTLLVNSLRVLATAIAISLVLTIVWIPLAGWRNTMGAGESYLYLVWLAALIAAATGLGWKALRGSIEAALLAWWVLGAVAAIAAPGMAYLFLWPSLTGALAVLLRPSGEQHDGWSWLAPATATLGVALILVVPAIDTFFQFAQPRPGNPDSEILPTVAVPLFLIALLSQLAASYYLASDHDLATPEPAEVEAPPSEHALDQAVGARVGVVVGALAGATLVAVTGSNSFALVAGAGLLGAGVGYLRGS
ncbi:MAG: M28 family peptidase [Acidimicrobiales bacterium]|nr:M28 family peptidase [Acidimicrobiales bacterium]